MPIKMMVPFVFVFVLVFVSLLLTCITLACAHALPGQGMGKLPTSKATSQRAVLVSKFQGKKIFILNSSREVEAPDASVHLQQNSKTFE